jgi:hypothetical protein
MSPSKAKTNPGDSLDGADEAEESLKRLGGGRWQTRDERFTIEPGSGTWSVVDAEETDDFGLSLVRGPLSEGPGIAEFTRPLIARKLLEVARIQAKPDIGSKPEKPPAWP